MQRVGSNRNPALDKFGTGKHGFTAGNPQTGTPATTPGAELFDALQEEIARVIEATGSALDPAKYDQLLTAIQTMQRGKATVSVAGGATVTLTAAQYGMPILILTGALTANINLIFPAISGAWIVRNQTTGAFTVTCKTAAGTGVAVSQGYNNALWGDGTNIYAEQSDWLSLALTGTPTAPTAAAGTNTTQVANMAAVQTAANGMLTKSVAGGATVTLSASEAGYATMKLTGALTANISVVVPNAAARWTIWNATTGAFTVTVKTAAGTGIVVTQGSTWQLLCDGTNVIDANSDFKDVALTGTPTAPTAAAGTNTMQIANTEFVQAAVAKQIQPIAAAVAGNALTLTLNPTSLGFRANALNSGAVNTRQVAAALSLTVPSGATLGTVNGQSARLVLLAIDNAGTVELAVANLAGGVNLDETTLISTAALSAAAGSASTIYSATARANVPFRVVGFIDITETTAGTWAAAPTTIQGGGGQALAALSSLGYGQTWQDVTAGRAIGTTYYNTTGRPILVQVSALQTSSGQTGAFDITVGGLTIKGGSIYGSGHYFAAEKLIKPGDSYSVAFVGSGTYSTMSWKELR